jgi:cytochrome c oxidase cbb3-type subunit 3
MKIITAAFLPLCIFSMDAYAEQANSGKQLYQAYCAQCHGMEGDGYGINVEYMEVLPRDHTDTEEMMTRTDEDLFEVIKFGGKKIDKSVLMPNWDGNLNDEQIHLLVKYLRVLCCETGDQ